MTQNHFCGKPFDGAAASTPLGGYTSQSHIEYKKWIPRKS